jgi:hypothetical protein
VKVAWTKLEQGGQETQTGQRDRQLGSESLCSEER